MINEELLTMLEELGIEEGIELKEAYKKIIEHCEVCEICNINPFLIMQYLDFLEECNYTTVTFDIETE